ncbi:MAG: diaminopimelate decarboxylase [Pseudomonadales bacterium]|nr:diaminopimelate decarboxylase [Pseudomonadales bacterium]
MSLTKRKNADLWIESVSLKSLADKYGTPAYVYSEAAIRHQYQAMQSAFGQQRHQICYAVKANSNIGVLAMLANMGAGFDVVSGGELERVLRAGGDPKKIVFSGVGKSVAELDFALKLDIHCLNVESHAELLRLEERAKLLGIIAPISLRINPDIDAKTHPYISTGLSENKFGITPKAAIDLYAYADKSEFLSVQGIDCHIGSQITELSPLLEAARFMLDMVDHLQEMGISITHLNMGGGVGVNYLDEKPFSIRDYASSLVKLLENYNLDLLVEPGRFLVANAGLLLTSVEYLKPASNPTTGRNFAIVDAAMNDLIRPALYQAQHRVEQVSALDDASALTTELNWDLVGPVCESADFLAKNCTLKLEQGALLAIMTAGAYGFVQSSNYNSRNRAPEIIISKDETHLVRRRETINDQLALESTFPCTLP